MKTEFARDLADQNQPIEQAFADRPGKPLKIRLQPMILTKLNYRAWRDVRWTLECDTPAEAFALRDAMRVFFEALASRGADAVTAALRSPAAKERVA